MKKAKGFTLVETLVSLALFSMMMVLVGLVLQRSQEQAALNDAKLILQNNLREALYKMSQEIRESAPSRVTVAADGSSVTFQVPANISTSGTITWSTPITYQIGGNGSQLIRADGTGQNTVYANDVQGLTFTSNGAPLKGVVYSVTGQRVLTNGRIISLTSNGEAELRNP